MCSKLEQRALLSIVTEQGIPMPVLKLAFAKCISRNWRFDMAWPAKRIALEIEGGMLPGVSGRKTDQRIREYCHKYNTAMILGWTVVHADSVMVAHGHHVDYVRDLLLARDEPTLRRISPGVYGPQLP